MPMRPHPRLPYLTTLPTLARVKTLAPPRPRLLLWALLAASWLVLLPLLWSAFATLPSAERLAESHMAEIPTLATLGWTVLRSALEAGAVLMLLWPWWERGFLLRLWAAALGALSWFLATTPLSVTRLWWVHRRWLAVLMLGLLMAAAGWTLARAVRRFTGAAPAKTGGG